MAKPFKVEELLTPAELADLEKFVRDTNGTRTIDECHQWLLERGYTIGRTAAGNWLTKFRGELMRERFSRSGELAQAIKSAVEGGSFDNVAAAANMQLVNVVFEQAATLQADGQIDPLDVQRMTRSLRNLVGTKAQHAKMLAERFDQQAQKLATKREITPADIDEVRKAVFG